LQDVSDDLQNASEPEPAEDCIVHGVREARLLLASFRSPFLLALIGISLNFPPKFLEAGADRAIGEAFVVLICGLVPSIKGLQDARADDLCRAIVRESPKIRRFEGPCIPLPARLEHRNASGKFQGRTE